MDQQASNVPSHNDDDDYFRDLALDLHHLHREDDPKALANKLHAFMNKHSDLHPDHINDVVWGLFGRSGGHEDKFAHGGMTRIHPALNIPGVHIRTAEAGEPIISWREMMADDLPQIDNPISVFPKPQRMFPEDARPAGGQYLNARTKEDMTGHKAAMASIGVNPGGRPYFNASPDSVEQTGSPGRGSAIAKTNLFKQRAGWNWLQAPEGHEDTSTIVSVEHRGDHHYALNAHFPNGVDLARYSEAKSEPRLRPTTRGNLTKGTQVGSISVRGKEHPVYDHVIVKADGGIVGDPDTDEGITAYHGSPHDFLRFDMSKIGTGEGAQAYGHGLYFAESEPVAKSYRNKLAMGQSTLDNRPMSEVASEKHRLPYGTQPTPEHDIADIIDSYGDTARHVMEARHPHLLSHYDKLVSEGRIKEPGHMYEVHINAHPDHFLDWNKPLYQQPEHIQKAIHSSIASAKEDAANGPRDMAGLVADGNRKPQRSDPDDYIGHDGAMLQQMLEKVYGAQGSTDILHKNGIKGIRYLDADSRSASKTPTRNYVVFDDKLVNVKRKYAEGGSVDEYPLDKDADEHRHSGGHMSWMSPDAFLDKAQEMQGDKDDKQAIKHFEKRIEHGDKLNPLALYPKGGQDGRHRATAAKHEGIKKIPVVQWIKKSDGGDIEPSPDQWEDAFHATHADVRQFDLSKAGSATTAGGSKAERAVFLTSDPENAKTYLAGQFVKRENAPHTEEMPYGVGRHYEHGANIMPLRINTKDFHEWDYGGNLYDANHMKEMIRQARKDKAPGIKIENIKDQGYMGLGSGKKTTTYVVFDTSRLRSRFAKFDPKAAKKKDLGAKNGGSIVNRALMLTSKKA